MNQHFTINLKQVLATLLTMAALIAGQQALAETVTYTISGNYEQTGNVNLNVNGQAVAMWPYSTTQKVENIELFGGIELSFGSDKTSSLIVLSNLLHIDADGNTGGYITLSHSTKYIYHVTLTTNTGNIEAWNMSKSYTYNFHEIGVSTIVVEYADRIPITDAVISGINNSYYVSNAAVTPEPTVTWHGNALTKNTHYTLSYQNNTTAGTATVTATGKDKFSTSTSVSANYTLVWTTYTVRFNANGGNGEMSDQNFTYNTAQNLTANSFSLTDYNFAGWNTAADGTGTIYSDQQSVSNLTPVNGETVTLYAQWATTTYTISYTLKGGTVTPANPTTYTETTSTFTLNNPTRTGCIFTGWTGSNGTTPQTTVTITQGSTGNRTYTANWTPITYNITYDLDGGSVATDNPTTYDITTSTFTLNNPTKSGYTFVGWTGSNGTTPQTTVNIIIGSTGDRNYTANWTLNTYYISYELNGGTETAPNPTTYTVETPTFTLNNPTKTGYFFAGWTYNNSNTLQTTVTIAQGSTGNRTYTAHWAIYTSYVDASGTLHENIPAIPLDDTKTTLAEGTYVVNSNVSFTDKTVELKGNVTLILADGYTMSITNEQATGITINRNKSLNIYGQSLGSGTLNIETRRNYAISMINSGAAYTYIQHSGKVSIHSQKACINGSTSSIQPSNITLLGGTLDIKQEKYPDYDIKAYNISILGGQFQSNGENGIAGVKITLGWTTPTDSIYAKRYTQSFYSSRMTIANGQALYYENEGENVIVSGTLDDDQISAIAGKTLRPHIVPITATKEIVGYGSGNGGWHLIASPLQGNTKVENVGGLISNTATHYDLYRFNQEAQLEWENYKATDNTGQPIHSDFTGLVNGRGYLYAHSTDTTLTFDGASYIGNGEVTLVKDDDANLSGWNLVGNPFNVNANIDRPFYIMNDQGSEIITASGVRNYIKPMEGIFVHADNDGDTVTFTPASQSINANNNSALLVVNLNQDVTERGRTTSAVIDRAIVRFDEGRQLPKLQIFENSSKLYIPQGGKEYAIVCAGRDGACTVSTMDVNEMPLNFKAKENGEYTITVNPEGVTFGYLHLIDNMTGADVDLLNTPSYTFTARNDDYASRFKLVFNALGSDSENEDFAFISNGEIIISGEGTLQVIDMLGRVIVCRDAMHCVSTAGITPGVYVLRLVNGENVKTQKILVK